MSKINKPNGTGLSRIIKAAFCSYKGFKAAYIHEAAFRQELLMSVVLLPFSFYLASSAAHFFVLILTLAFVLFAEIINSAIEALADKITLEHDELIGRAKDLGSAGVFIAFTILCFVWLHAVYFKLFEKAL